MAGLSRELVSEKRLIIFGAGPPSTPGRFLPTVGATAPLGTTPPPRQRMTPPPPQTSPRGYRGGKTPRRRWRRRHRPLGGAGGGKHSSGRKPWESPLGDVPLRPGLLLRLLPLRKGLVLHHVGGHHEFLDVRVVGELVE